MRVTAGATPHTVRERKMTKCSYSGNQNWGRSLARLRPHSRNHPFVADYCILGLIKRTQLDRSGLIHTRKGQRDFPTASSTPPVIQPLGGTGRVPSITTTVGSLLVATRSLVGRDPAWTPYLHACPRLCPDAMKGAGPPLLVTYSP